MRFTKILCPIDFSEGSRHAMRVAARFATESNAPLELVHVWFVPPVTDAGESILAPEVVQQMNDDAQRGLDASVREATALGAKQVTSSLMSGAPWQAIVDAAKAADLIVIGTHGRTGLSRILLGSVAEQVIRHAPCSVLAVRADTEAASFHHVLCAVDFSEASQTALEVAADIVAPSGSLTLLHVIELPIAYEAEIPLANYTGDLDKWSAQSLETWAAKLRGTRTVATRSRYGRAGAETLAAVDEDPSIDLVVLGTHGRTGISRMLLGSVAEKIVRHARCPVLVARKR